MCIYIDRCVYLCMHICTHYAELCAFIHQPVQSTLAPYAACFMQTLVLGHAAETFQAVLGAFGNTDPSLPSQTIRTGVPRWSCLAHAVGPAVYIPVAPLLGESCSLYHHDSAVALRGDVYRLERFDGTPFGRRPKGGDTYKLVGNQGCTN